MKKLIALAALTLSMSSFAATVRVTSFVYLRSGEPQAELCGTVEGATASPSFIRAQIDHRTNRPATYNTIAGTDGKFCLSVVTYRGTAEVSLFESTTAVESFIQ